jgi:hypothetical protein
MLKKYENQIVLTIFALWVIGFSFQTGRATQQQEDRKQIEAAHKSSDDIQNQKLPRDSESRPNSPSNPQAENRGREAPEVVFVGLKLGEGLLVFVTIWLVLVTKALVDGTRDTAERQLRAYIVASAGEVQRIDGGFILSATLKNTGQTPAFNARIMGETFGESYPLTIEHPHPKPLEDFGVPLGSGEEFHCAYRIFMDDPDDTLHRIQGGEVGLWIQGTIIYDDCFKKSHTTKFRFVYGGRVAAATIHMHADRHGNEAD